MRNEWTRKASPNNWHSEVHLCPAVGVLWGKLFKSCILAISWHLIIILKNNFLNSEFLKVPSSCSYRSTLVTVTFIGQMFYPSQSEISFHIIKRNLILQSETLKLSVEKSFLHQFYTVFDLIPSIFFSTNLQILQLEAPRSLYSSPGYNNNISQ